MNGKHWYRCGTGAAACPRSESGEAFCIGDEEYDSWKCPHSKFCKDSLIRLTWMDRHRNWVKGSLAGLALLIAGGGIYYWLNRETPPLPPMEPPPKAVEAALPPPVQPPPEPEPKPSPDSARIWEALGRKLDPEIPHAIRPLPIQKFYFDKKKAVLDSKLRPYLGEAIQELSKPEYQGKHLAVVGFADATGSDKTNCPLSEARANTVAEELKRRITIGIVPMGLCSTRPVGSNDTPEGQQMNRRVELWVFDLK